MNAYQNATQFFENLDEAISGIEKGFKKAFSPIQQGPPSYYFKKINEYIRTLFDKAPFKVGDRIHLIREPKIEKGSGWWPYRHTFKKGATGVVKEIDFAEGHFCAWIQFDRTLCNYAGNLHIEDYGVEEVKEPGTFHLWESYFVRDCDYEEFVPYQPVYEAYAPYYPEEPGSRARKAAWEREVLPLLGPGSHVKPKHTGKGELLGWLIINPITCFEEQEKK